MRSRINAARALITPNHSMPGGAELSQAAALVENLALDNLDKHLLSSQILVSALDLLASRRLKPDSKVQVFGEPLQETRVRLRLEKSYRSMARMLTGEERIKMVDRANAVRPHTLF